MARYLVTGCAGFIGSHLTETLLGQGHEVVGVDVFRPYYPRSIKDANLANALRSTDFRLEEVDLARDPLEPLFDGVHGVFHLAAQPGVRGSWGDAFEIHLRDNIQATQRVLEAAAREGVRVALASSSSVYGDAPEYPTREDSPTRPVSPYGVSKLACEHLATAYGAALGVDVVALRYFTVYGPRQRPDMAFSRIIAALGGGAPFHVLGSGHQSRDATFVGDAVTATIAAFHHGAAGAAYNVGGGAEATVLEVIAIAERILGRRLPVEIREVAAGDVRRTCADTGQLRRQTGWAPSVSLEEGLRAQVEASLPAIAAQRPAA